MIEGMDVDLCSRCKLNPATMVHATRKKKDGTTYKIRWCNNCQKIRMRGYMKKARFYEKISDPKGWQAVAKANHQRILEKYGNVTV